MSCIDLTGCCSELDNRISKVEKVLHEGTLFAYQYLLSLDDLPKNPSVEEQRRGYIFEKDLYLYVGPNNGTTGYLNQYINAGQFKGDGEIGVGIESIESETSKEGGGTNTMTIHLTDGSEYTVYTKNGDEIKSITSKSERKTDTTLNRTYTLYELYFHNADGNEIAINDGEYTKNHLELKIYDGKDGRNVTTDPNYDVSEVVFHFSEMQEYLEVNNLQPHDVVRYDVDQTQENNYNERKTARHNIGAASEETVNALYNEIKRIEEFLKSIEPDFVVNNNLFN